MSQEIKLEEGPTEQVPGKQNDGTSSSNDSWIVNILLWISVVVFVIAVLLIESIKQVIKFAKNRKVFLLLCVIAIILDPLFFYIPEINDEKKCIELDKKLGITATVLRSVFDFLKLIHLISEVIRIISEPLTESELHDNRRKRRVVLFVIDILAIVPIPQVLLIFPIRGTKFLFAMTFFFLQYLLRAIRIYILVTQATGVTGILADATWAIVAFNLLLYTLGGHVFGALWYFYAIRKVVGCWKKVCGNLTGCSHNSFYCDDNFGDYTILNDFCSLNAGNTTNYNFGIYTGALESGIVEVTDFPKKLLHCLQWGLQNLSAFGQNLQTSTDVWENIFAICMTNFGVLLFVFLIGKMQSDTERSKKIKAMWREINRWSLFDSLSPEVKEHIRLDRRKKWQETKRVDVDNLLNDLPEETRREIKREIGTKLIKKVKEFENWIPILLEDLCDCLKPVLFEERTCIIREGDPIDKMLFVLKGRLWTYSSTSSYHMEDGDIFGQQIITWAWKEDSSGLPPSRRTIRALTNVEAFTLMADDLKYVLERRQDYEGMAFFLQYRWRNRKKILHPEREKQKSAEGLKLRLQLLMDERQAKRLVKNYWEDFT